MSEPILDAHTIKIIRLNNTKWDFFLVTLTDSFLKGL